MGSSFHIFKTLSWMTKSIQVVSMLYSFIFNSITFVKYTGWRHWNFIVIIPPLITWKIWLRWLLILIYLWYEAVIIITISTTNLTNRTMPLLPILLYRSLQWLPSINLSIRCNNVLRYFLLFNTAKADYSADVQSKKVFFQIVLLWVQAWLSKYGL